MKSNQVDRQRLQRLKEQVLASNKLNHAAIAAIDTLDKQACFSSNDLWLLEQIEQRFQLTYSLG